MDALAGPIVLEDAVLARELKRGALGDGEDDRPRGEDDANCHCHRRRREVLVPPARVADAEATVVCGCAVSEAVGWLGQVESVALATIWRDVLHCGAEHRRLPPRRCVRIHTFEHSLFNSLLREGLPHECPGGALLRIKCQGALHN